MRTCIRWLAFVGVATLTGAACEDVVVSVAEVASVEVVPNPVDLHLGDRASLSATLREEGGRELDGRSIDWSVDDPEVASVSPHGEVEALRAGSTQVRAVAQGVMGTAKVFVAPGPEIEPGRESAAADPLVGSGRP